MLGRRPQDSQRRSLEHDEGIWEGQRRGEEVRGGEVREKKGGEERRRGVGGGEGRGDESFHLHS